MVWVCVCAVRVRVRVCVCVRMCLCVCEERFWETEGWTYLSRTCLTRRKWYTYFKTVSYLPNSSECSLYIARMYEFRKQIIVQTLEFNVILQQNKDNVTERLKRNINNPNCTDKLDPLLAGEVSSMCNCKVKTFFEKRRHLSTSFFAIKVRVCRIGISII